MRTNDLRTSSSYPMQRLLLYGRTVSHLKPRQVGYYLLRRVLPAPLPFEELVEVGVSGLKDGSTREEKEEGAMSKGQGRKK